MRRKKRKHDSEHTCRALPQSLLHAPKGHDGVLHRPDQTRRYRDQNMKIHKTMLWIRIRSDPKFLPDPEKSSRIRNNKKKNLFHKIHNFYQNAQLKLFLIKKFPKKPKITKSLAYILKNFIYRPNCTNKVRVCRIRNRIRTSFKVGSGVGSETNHSGSTTLVLRRVR